MQAINLEGNIILKTGLYSYPIKCYKNTIDIQIDSFKSAFKLLSLLKPLKQYIFKISKLRKNIVLKISSKNIIICMLGSLVSRLFRI